MPLYTAFTVDELTIPRLGELAVGVPGAEHWVIDLPNDANKKFVSDFTKKYGRSPSAFAARSYDAGFLIDSAVKAVGGDLTKKDAMRDAMRKANFASVRGSYRYGNNNFPNQNFYLQNAVEGCRWHHQAQDGRTGNEGFPGSLSRSLQHDVVAQALKGLRQGRISDVPQADRGALQRSLVPLAGSLVLWFRSLVLWSSSLVPWFGSLVLRVTAL